MQSPRKPGPEMTSFPLLETISDPSDLRGLDRKQLAQLAAELRAFIVDSVASTGGHLSSNLGTVELTIALHYVNVFRCKILLYYFFNNSSGGRRLFAGF